MPIRTIIFDLGGVILNLDQNLTLHQFAEFGIYLEAINQHSNILTDYECGLIDSDTFRSTLMRHAARPMHEQVIDTAWNAMLRDIPMQRLEMIRKLKNHFKILLLSNTNDIHFKCFSDYLKTAGYSAIWKELFDHQILSFETGMRKPDAAIYSYAARQADCSNEQCLFIDDSPANIRGAQMVGMPTIWAQQPLDEMLMKEITAAVND